MTKTKNESENALCLIEEMRQAWLDCYNYPDATEYDKHFAMIQLDKIDAYINHHFGKQKWDSIINLLTCPLNTDRRRGTM